MLARLVAISALAAGALAIASPTLAQQQRAPVQAPSNIQQPEGQQRDARTPALNQRASQLARDAAAERDERQAEARRERDRNDQTYTVQCASIREVVISSLIVTIECDREDRFGDNRYEYYFTTPRRYRESRISRFPRDWLAERLVETAYEVQRTPGATLELQLMRASADPSDGNLWGISSFSIVYPD
jgi:hypothetical protein